MKQIDLSVSVGSTALKNPVLGASGTVAFGKEVLSVGAGRLGGIVLKTVTPDAREGHPPPRVAETPAGMINAIGLENPGIDELCRECLPLLAGAAGNLVDRILFQSVRDFIDFHVWPVFNVADVLICIGAAGLSYASLRPVMGEPVRKHEQSD